METTGILDLYGNLDLKDFIHNTAASNSNTHYQYRTHVAEAWLSVSCLPNHVDTGYAAKIVELTIKNNYWQRNKEHMIGMHIL